MNFSQLDLDGAREYEGHDFAMALDGELSLPLTLVEVAPIKTKPDATAGFSLLFRGPADPVMGQASYLITTEGSEPHPIFLVPIGADPDGVSYEAIFTRLD